jgi:hypothetical protein
VLLTVLLLPAVVPRLRGQASSPLDQTQLAFEVASVKLNTSGDGSRRGIGTPPGGRLMMTDVPLRTILRFAYDIQNVQLVGGPAWIDTDFFDIEAKAPSAVVASNAQVPMAAFRAMTRSLLADRFKLSARREARHCRSTSWSSPGRMGASARSFSALPWIAGRSSAATRIHRRRKMGSQRAADCCGVETCG